MKVADPGSTTSSKERGAPDGFLFSRFKAVIRDQKYTDIDDQLLLDRVGSLSVYYAPFDYTNDKARVVVVGVTPGKTQMLNALNEARRLLNLGLPDDDIKRQVKKAASFSGSLRPNLVAMLDHIGVHKWLGIGGCSQLFDQGSGLLQSTSLLRFPVFVNGTNYNGAPNPVSHPLLRKYLVDHFGRECTVLKNAVFVPLGDKVTEAVRRG